MSGDKIAFTMKLKPGNVSEYRLRHKQIWPELIEVLHAAGICDYSIFLDEESNTLFAVLRCSDTAARQALPQNPIMQKWWDYMAPLMEVLPSNEPVSKGLKEIFYLK